jgi:hypothetical protein
VLWTPTVLIYDGAQKERFRIEGYLPRGEFRAHLALALARVSYMHKQFPEAERRYRQIIGEHAGSTVIPEAIYWAEICNYKATSDHTVLGTLPTKLAEFPDSEWTKTAIPFAG